MRTQLLRGPTAVAAVVVVLHERNGAEELARVGVSFAAEEVVGETVGLHVGRTARGREREARVRGDGSAQLVCVRIEARGAEGAPG